jgi:hypothetical protein
MGRRVLAEGSLTRLEICSCGSCYLTIGPVTVSIHREVIEELAQTIARALGQLRLQTTEVLPEATTGQVGGEVVTVGPAERNEEQTRTAAWGPPRSN